MHKLQNKDEHILKKAYTLADAILVCVSAWGLTLNSPSRVGARSANLSLTFSLLKTGWGGASQRFGPTWAWFSDTKIKTMKSNDNIWNRRQQFKTLTESMCFCEFGECCIRQRVLAILKSALSSPECPFGNSPMSANFEFCGVFENVCDVMFACLVAFMCRVLVSLVFASYSSDLLGS